LFFGARGLGRKGAVVADVGRGEAETKKVNWIFLDRQSFVKNTSSLLKNQQQSSAPFIKRGICFVICTSLYRSAHVRPSHRLLRSAIILSVFFFTIK
jgi:hypothetical protein